MRRREAGRGAVPRGSGSSTRHSGGAGAPPGLTMKPCQELADDRKVQTKRRLSPLLSVDAERGTPTGQRTAAGHLRRKRGPVCREKTPQIACATASLHERMWRAERRPPRSARIADTIGLRLSARHPLIRGATMSKPQTHCVVGRSAHALIASPRRKPGSRFFLWRFAPLDSGLRRNDECGSRASKSSCSRRRASRNHRTSRVLRRIERYGVTGFPLSRE